MSLRSKIYFEIEQLVPSFGNAFKLQVYLRDLLQELIIQGEDKKNLFFISKNELIMRELLRQSKDQLLNEDQQLEFLQIKKDVLSFLNKSKNVDDLL